MHWTKSSSELPYLLKKFYSLLRSLASQVSGSAGQRGRANSTTQVYSIKTLSICILCPPLSLHFFAAISNPCLYICDNHRGRRERRDSRCSITFGASYPYSPCLFRSVNSTQRGIQQNPKLLYLCHRVSAYDDDYLYCLSFRIVIDSPDRELASRSSKSNRLFADMVSRCAHHFT